MAGLVNEMLAPVHRGEYRVVMTMVQAFSLNKQINVTRIRMYFPVLAHMAFVVAGYAPIIKEIHIEFPDKKTPAITTLEAFYLYLSKVPHWGDAGEFDYINDVKKLKRKKK